MAAKIRGTTTTVLPISATSARLSANLVAGQKYLLTSSVDCFFRISDADDDATTSDCPLWAKQYIEIFLDGDIGLRLAAITSSGSGDLYVIPLEGV